MERPVDPLTGLPQLDEFTSERPVITEKLRRSVASDRPDPTRYDKTGRVRLGPEFTDWLAGPDN